MRRGAAKFLTERARRVGMVCASLRARCAGECVFYFLQGEMVNQTRTAAATMRSLRFMVGERRLMSALSLASHWQSK